MAPGYSVRFRIASGTIAAAPGFGSNGSSGQRCSVPSSVPGRSLGGPKDYLWHGHFDFGFHVIPLVPFHPLKSFPSYPFSCDQ